MGMVGALVERTADLAAYPAIMNPQSMSSLRDSMEPRPPRGEDLPCDDGEPMETERHRRQMNLLVDSLEWAWRDRNDFYAAGNMGLYYSETQALKNDFRAPDVFVVVGTDRHERKRWVVWEEDGLTPDVVIEITSPSTEDVDRGKKKDIYARLLKVAFYAVYDPFSAQLEAWTLDTTRRVYVPLAPDERGLVPCAPLGLSLGVVRSNWAEINAPWLRWHDANGVVEHPHERATREAERAAREAENAAREAENAAREAENAAREAERATREAARADRAEQELARLREELRRRG